MVEVYSNNIALRCVAESSIGGRRENQDDMGFVDTPLGFLCVICDGMGGGPGGKTASYIVKHEIITCLCACSSHADREYAFKMAVSNAQDAIDQKTESEPSLKGMGSTFVAILINSVSALVAHVGDSRCYQLRGSKCIYRSQDHSLVAELVRRKVLTEEEARLSPQSNVITRGLGGMSNHVPDLDNISFKKGDRFVLCTDGVWGSMPDNDLEVRFTLKSDIAVVVNSISQEIDRIGFAKGGGHDNHSIAIIDVKSDSLRNVILKKRILFYSFMTLGLVISFAIGVALFKYCHENSSDESDICLRQDNTISTALPSENTPAQDFTFVGGQVPDSSLANKADSLVDTKSGITEESPIASGMIIVKDQQRTVTLLQEIIECLEKIKKVKGRSVESTFGGIKKQIKTVSSRVKELKELSDNDVFNDYIYELENFLKIRFDKKIVKLKKREYALSKQSQKEDIQKEIDNIQILKDKILCQQ